MKFSSKVADAVTKISDDGMKVEIKGNVLNPNMYKKMRLIAPNPSTRGASYSGSALPYPCPQIAFDGTPNTANIPEDGVFSAVFQYPNSYYSHDALIKVASSIFLILQEHGNDIPIFVRFELPDQHKLRTLTHRPRRNVLGPSFHVLKEDIHGIASQEQILRRIGEVKENYDLA